MSRIALFLMVVLGAGTVAMGANSLEVTVANPGFEELRDGGLPAAWSADGQAYTSGTDEAHGGSRSLRYENDDPKRYIVPSVPLALQVGKRYEISAWIKTRGLKGDESGATFCLEWDNTEGKWAGGEYPAGFKGDTEWTELRFMTGPIPPVAARCHLACYVRKGMTGQAWFDDVQVRRVLEPALQSAALLEPNYRGLLLEGSGRVRVKVAVCLDDSDVDPGQVQAELSLSGSGGASRSVRMPAPGGELNVEMVTGDLARGAYMLRLRLLAGERELGAREWPVQIVSADNISERTSYIDSHNRLIRDGEPFFPLGMYWGSVNEKDLATYADSAFNCLMPYGSPDQAQMDMIERHGLKVIYSVKDTYAGSTWCPADIKTPADERPWIEERVRAYRDHPALLGWYLNDELGLEYADRLRAHQEWVSEGDPNHPTWVVLYQVGSLAGYADTFDVIGTDPYPIPGSPASMAGAWARMTVGAFAGRRPVWMVPQVFNWATYRGEEEKAGLRPPTLEEMRSMAWQCIVAGARGLIFYSWFDIQRDTVVPFETQWARCKQMAAEIRDLAPVILSVEPAAPISFEGDGALQWTTRKVGDTQYVIVVNSEPEAAKGVFTLAKAPQSVWRRGSAGLAGTDGAKLPVELEGLEVEVYEVR